MSDTISRSAAEDAILEAFGYLTTQEKKHEDKWAEAKEWYAACKCKDRRQGLDFALVVAMRTLRDLPSAPPKDGVT